MKLRFFILIMFLAVVAELGVPQQTQGPLSKNQVTALVKAGMQTPELVKLIHDHGIDFDLTDDYLQALAKAGAQEPAIQALRAARPKPLTQEQVLQLVAGGVPSERAAALVKQRGIDFLPEEEYLNTLRLAGSDDTLITMLREASKTVTAQFVVETSPDAEVYLDNELQGRADAQGELAMKAKLGAHALKVSLAGKKDYQQSLTLVREQGTKIKARLADVPGSIKLRTLAGASILLDGVSKGMTDANGELVLGDVSPGPHELRVSAPEKMECLQRTTVTPGQEARVEVTLQDAPPSPRQVRANPKDRLEYVWIPPGTFMMGCSPGDSECSAEEKPAHQVTITKGFWLGRTVVTVGAYKRFAGATGRQMPRTPRFNVGWANDAMPIVNVSWDDATALCGWAGGRLPTEAEWEYAARGGNTEARYGNLDEVAWYNENSGEGTHEVAQKHANGFGLFDMLGNVWEWVNDWYGEHYYAASPERDPRGPDRGGDRVLRGGSWDSVPWFVRVSVHPKFGSTFRYAHGVGVRCAREVLAP